MRPNFELVTELQTLTRRDFPLADPTLLAPIGANPLVDGEWLELNGDYKLARVAGTPAQVANESVSKLLYPVHTERGRYDTQAIGKVNVLMLGMYEAETAIVDLTGLALGDALTVNNVTIGGLVKRGLKEKVDASACVVGYVSKLIGGGRVRFVHYGNQ